MTHHRVWKRVSFFQYEHCVIVTIGYFASSPPPGTYTRLGGWLSSQTVELPEWVIALFPEALVTTLLAGIERPKGYDKKALFAEFDLPVKVVDTVPTPGKNALSVGYAPIERT